MKHLSDIESKLNLKDSSYVVREADGSTIILSQGDFSWDSSMKLVTPDRENPGDRVYEKRFEKSKIYLPNERDAAYQNALGITQENARNRAFIILSMVGYSSLKSTPELGGMSTNQYETVTQEIYHHLIQQMREKLPNLDIVSIDGASDMGIDKPLLEYRLEQNIPGLSFSCPEYIRYVQDTGSDIFISKDADSYLAQFAMCSDVMMVLGGRDAAFWKNYLISEYSYPLGAKIAPVADIIATSTQRHDLPYFIPGQPFEQSKILNASRAIMEKSGMSLDTSVENLKTRVVREAVEYARHNPIFQSAQ